MFRFAYKCDCCGAESENSIADDNTSPPRLPDTWRRFALEHCIPDDRAYSAQTWEEEISLDGLPRVRRAFAQICSHDQEGFR